MIKSADIRDAIARLLKVEAGLELKVFYNHVADAGESYAFVRFRPLRQDYGFGYFQKIIRVTIQIVLAPDINGEVRHTDLYDIADSIDEAINGNIRILDRFITVLDTETNIFDDILTYDFKLDFTDCTDKLPAQSQNEFMRELDLILNEEFEIRN